MPDLLTRPLLRREEPAWGTRVPWFAAVLASGWVFVATLAMSVLPAVAVWLADGADGSLADPLRFGGRLWLLSNRVTLDVDGATLAFAPLGLTVMFVLLMYRSGRWAAHQAGTATPRGVVLVLVPAVLLYALGAGVVAALTSAADVSSSPLMAAGAAASWAVAGFFVGVLHETGFDEVWLSRTAPEIRAALAGSGVAVASLLAFGALLVIWSTLASSAQVGVLAEALDAGAVGNGVLAVGGGVLVPNAIVWAMSFALGPGFVVGTETVVAPSGVDLGMLPAIPVLGALPAGVSPTLGWMLLAGPVAAGSLAGFLVHRRLATSGEPLSIVVLAAGGAGAAAAFVTSVLALLSGGSVGAARLSDVGPVPWEVAAMTFITVGVPAMITAALLFWLGTRSSKDSDDDAAEQPAVLEP